MNYCYCEVGQAAVTLELTIDDLQELRAAVKAAAACEGASFRVRRLSDALTAVQHALTESIRRHVDEMQRQLQVDLE